MVPDGNAAVKWPSEKSIAHRTKRTAEPQSRAGKHTMKESAGDTTSKRRCQATVEDGEEERGKSESDDDSDEGEGQQTSIIRERGSKRK
jgi:hypothetical protein